MSYSPSVIRMFNCKCISAIYSFMNVSHSLFLCDTNHVVIVL